MIVFSPNASLVGPAELLHSEIPNDTNVTTVYWPGSEAKLVLDIPQEQEHTVVTRGLVVCSGVSVGFVNEEGCAGMYMSHTYWDSAEMASRLLEKIIGLSENRGYVPCFATMLSREGAAGREYRSLITPIFEELKKHHELKTEVSTYGYSSDWHFKHDNSGLFSVSRFSFKYKQGAKGRSL